MATKQKKHLSISNQGKISKTQSFGNEFALKSNLSWLVILLFVTAVIYSPVAGYEFTKLDDDFQVTENQDITSLNGENLKQIFSSYYIGMYQPLTTLTYAVEYSLDGLNPSVYHITNLLLHLLNILLVFLLIRKLVSSRIVLILTTVFFAVHPMFVEVVA